MTYPETLYTALASAASGGAVFCALCMIAAALCRRPCRKRFFSVFCVLLSIVTASSALLFIFTPFSAEHLKMHGVIVWCIVFFAGGTLLTAFYRILIPFTVSVYSSCAVYIWYYADQVSRFTKSCSCFGL